MSFLKDKEWESMDWLNRAVEPYVFSINDELAKLPSEYQLNYDHIIYHIGKAGGTISVNSMLLNIYREFGVLKNATIIFSEIGIDTLFELTLDEGTTIDMVNRKINGKIAFVKKKESLSEEDILNFLQKSVINLSFNTKKSSTGTLNEVMDILDCKEGRSSSSVRKKVQGLKAHLFDVYSENRWNIRNVDIALKMLMWIKHYCEHEDRWSLANMSKLKCMIYNGHPIYSMEEII